MNRDIIKAFNYFIYSAGLGIDLKLNGVSSPFLLQLSGHSAMGLGTTELMG